MTVVRTCWLIGSVRDLEAQTLTIGGGPQAITAGSRYLYHPTSALSLLAQVQAAMTAAGVAGASAVLLENRKVRLSCSPGSFSLTWPVDNVLRDLLGFTGNLAAVSSATATNISKLLWSPARRESSMRAPLGALGHTVHQVNVSVSPHDGTRSTVAHGERTFNEFVWKMVAAARVQTSSKLGGEYVAFWNTVLSQGSLWHLWRLLEEDTAGSDPMSLATSIGPYVASQTDWEFGRAPGFEWSDVWNPITLPCELQQEYS
jgi:hypothetical protein